MRISSGRDSSGFWQPELCRHKRTISAVTAGLERTVCEECGAVSVRYLEKGVHGRRGKNAIAAGITPRPEPEPKPAPRRVCTVCQQPARFMIPSGLVCSDHAWEAASRQETTTDNIWIPILIDSSTSAGRSEPII